MKALLFTVVFLFSLGASARGAVSSRPALAVSAGIGVLLAAGIALAAAWRNSSR